MTLSDLSVRRPVLAMVMWAGVAKDGPIVWNVKWIPIDVVTGPKGKQASNIQIA
mgnify:CR=1 FL=1